MSSLHSFTFIIIILLPSLSPPLTNAQETIKSPQQLDLLIRDYTFRSSFINMTRTGEIHNVNLPANLSGAVRAQAARFRCGSLTRYGARIDGFTLGIGVMLYPCVERVMLITHRLSLNWSSIYSANYNLSGYQLVSPILGLAAYNAGGKRSNSPNSSYPFEVGIRSAQGNSIAVNFTNPIDDPIVNPLCAIFEGDGKTVSLKPPISDRVCGSTSNGHFGLVVKLPPPAGSPPPAAVTAAGGGGRAAVWKVAVASSVGSALGIVLLGLLVVAMFAKVKKKARMVEMERRAYEEEALQVSMVGHVRAPVAAGTRTVPTIEHHFVHYNPK
ncbi:unnamed protein product [Linum tenue]|uniref:Uncharacterized protein n=1 Tax=Linum tenue TaxID=586396 RepID=A0AAV0Q2G5_9ROSI|nr:unnamed protein product [Linum tenue]